MAGSKASSALRALPPAAKAFSSPRGWSELGCVEKFGRVRYFPKGIPYPEEWVISVLPSSPANSRRIIDALINRPGLARFEVFPAYGVVNSEIGLVETGPTRGQSQEDALRAHRNSSAASDNSVQPRVRALLFAHSSPNQRNAVPAESPMSSQSKTQRAWVFGIVSLSGGEPLTYDGLTEVVATAVALGLREWILVSNGILICSPRYEDNAHRFSVVALSLDGLANGRDNSRLGQSGRGPLSRPGTAL